MQIQSCRLKYLVHTQNVYNKAMNYWFITQATKVCARTWAVTYGTVQ